MDKMACWRLALLGLHPDRLLRLSGACWFSGLTCRRTVMPKAAVFFSQTNCQSMCQIHSETTHSGHKYCSNSFENYRINQRLLSDGTHRQSSIVYRMICMYRGRSTGDLDRCVMSVSMTTRPRSGQVYRHSAAGETSSRTQGDDTVKDVQKQELLMTLLNNGLTSAAVDVLLNVKPELQQANIIDVGRCVHCLRSAGFSGNQVASLLGTKKNIWTEGKMNMVDDIINNLRQIGFREGKVQDFIVNHPEMLSVKPSKIPEMYNELKAYFSHNEVYRMIGSGPEVFFTSADSLEEKIRYVHEVMGFPQKKMVKANVVRYSLDHIMCRHKLLERAGLFQKPDKNGVTTIENPTLKDILATSDRAFADQVARMSLEEYEAFKAILELEEELEYSTDSD